MTQLNILQENLCFARDHDIFWLKKFLVKFLLTVHIFGKIVAVRMPKLGNFDKIIEKYYKKLRTFIFDGN